MALLPRATDLKFLMVGGYSMDRLFSAEIEHTMFNPRFEELAIDDWPNMGLPLRHHYNFHRYVQMESCNSLSSFPLYLVPSLKDLDLHDCSNLEMILVSDVSPSFFHLSGAKV